MMNIHQKARFHQAVKAQKIVNKKSEQMLGGSGARGFAVHDDRLYNTRGRLDPGLGVRYSSRTERRAHMKRMGVVECG